MRVASYEFFLVVLFLGAFYFVIPSQRVRRSILSLGNLLALWLSIPNLSSWIVLAAFLGSGYGMAVYIRGKSSTKSLVIYISVLIVAFVILKRYEFLGAILPGSIIQHGIQVTGLSYMFFRQIHFLVDVSQEQIESLSLWTYLNYQTNFFCLLSGPIQRYQDFQTYWQAPIPLLASRGQVLLVYLRIFVGIIKMTLLASFCLTGYERLGEWYVASGGVNGGGPDKYQEVLALLGMLYLYPLYIYLNFAGYCDVVIGGAALVGLKLPENFDRPYLSRNLIEFWTRWHRTLGYWIRDYIFAPLYMWMASRYPGTSSWNVFPCYFVAFFLVGMWHGTTLPVAIFALFQGVGVTLAKLWEFVILKWKGRPGLRGYMQSNLIRTTSIVITCHYFAVSILFFPTEVDEQLTLLHFVRVWLGV